MNQIESELKDIIMSIDKEDAYTGDAYFDDEGWILFDGHLKISLIADYVRSKLVELGEEIKSVTSNKTTEHFWIDEAVAKYCGEQPAQEDGRLKGEVGR